jgi:vancomycin resistance protein VanJ
MEGVVLFQRGTLQLKKSLWLGLWVSAFAVNAHFVLRWLTGDQLLIVRMANYFLPWIGLGLLVGLMLSLSARKRKLSLLLTLPLIIISPSYVPLMLRCGVSAAAQGAMLKVMSHNIWRDNEDMSAAAAIIQREKPDILLLQEITPEQLKTLLTVLNLLDGDQQFNFAHDPVNLAAVGSRFEIKNSDSLPHKNRSHKVCLESPFGLLTVINIHGVRTGWSIRHEGMEALLREDVDLERGPVILGGDFNTNEQSETFKLIEKHLINAHEKAGCGFGFTFPAKSYNFPFLPRASFSFPPFIRIDHIFHSGHFKTVRSYILKDSGGSDHLPVVAELAFVNPKKI